jgi:hypothetical protein
VAVVAAADGGVVDAVDVGFGVDDDDGAGILPGQIRARKPRAQIHSRLVLCAHYTLHAHGAR